MRGRPLAVVLFDLDNFKEYNDRYGHAAGDEALKVFGGVLLKTTRQMNLSGRFGGEEFLSVLAESSSEGAMVFAERVRASLRAAGLGLGPLTVSAGVAGYHRGLQTPDELLAGADHALYRAKREGRDCVRLFGKTPLGSEEGAVAERRPAGVDSEGYPRTAAALGGSRPPITLLPHHITQFGGGRRLLLIGDNDRLRAFVATYLNREGFEVTEVADMNAASDQLGQEHDIAVLDVHTSTGSPADLIRSIKSRWPATQVLALAGASDARVGAEAQRAGADRHLFQPFTMPELRAHLVDALDRRDRHSTSAVGNPDSSTGERGRAELGRDKVIQGVRYLVEGAEAKDTFKIGRSTYVAAYAVELARALDPVGELLGHDSLHLGAEVHDVGMIAVPGDILNKPGTLTEAEWGQIKDHPKIGHDLLAAVLNDSTALAIVRSHHERWDGSGYPDGLAGAAIPLGARVVAVADTLEALTSKRAFRKARDWHAAVQEILGAMGSQFDPDLLEAFERAVPSLKTIGGETRSGSD
jgi:cyclic di-GMP phosphodiesterase